MADQSTPTDRRKFARFEEVKVKFAGRGHPQIDLDGVAEVHTAEVEDYWDTLTGRSWTVSDGNPAAIIYGLRSGMNGLPVDDDVIYVKIGPFGHLVHISEVVDG
jgi:hypothetical protein